MFTSLLFLFFVSVILNWLQHKESKSIHADFRSLDQKFTTLSKLLAQLLTKPEITAGEIVKKKQHRPFRTIKTWDEQRAELEAQYPDPFEQALKQVQKNEQVMKES